MFVKLMNRNFIYLGLLVLFSFIPGCSQLAPNGPKDLRKAAVSASIKFAYQGFSPESLTKIVIEVTHSDIDTIRKKLTLGAGGAKGQIEVPMGKLLTFTAIAYQMATPVLSGSTQFKPEADKTANIQIILDFLVPALILTPPDSTIDMGDQITVYLQARHCTDLGTIGARICFDNTKLKVMELGREDDFLKSNSGAINQLKFTKDNESGTVDIVLGVFPASAAVSGDGKIGKIVFKTLAGGAANLTISLDNSVDSDLGIFDKNADLIQALALGSSIQIQ